MAERKVLMNALVHEVTVTSRADVVPVFRFPSPLLADGKVRPLARSAPSAWNGTHTQRPVRRVTMETAIEVRRVRVAEA